MKPGEVPEGICPRCTGRGDAHYLTCPVLRLPIGRYLREPVLTIRPSPTFASSI